MSGFIGKDIRGQQLIGGGYCETGDIKSVGTEGKP